MLERLHVPIIAGLMCSRKVSVTRPFMEHQTPRIIKLRNTPVHPLSEQEIAEATLAFANGATLKLLGKDTFFKGRRVDDEILKGFFARRTASRDKAPSDHKGKVTTDEFQKYAAGFHEAIRENIRGDISRSLLDPSAVARSIVERDDTAFLHVNPIVHATARGLQLTYHHRFASFIDLVVFGLILLVDESRPFREKLCECHLQSCRLFFFEIKPPTGRPQRRYCSEEHLKAAHAQNAPRRMRKIRRKPEDPK
jgi:hypothetical protein